MTIIKPNGGPPKPPEIEIDGHKYTVESNIRADRVVGFAGVAASQFAMEYLRSNSGEFPDDAKERAELFDKLFAQADEWRLAMDRFKHRKLEQYDAEVRGRSTIIKPVTAGEVRDSYPPNAFGGGR